MTAVVGVISAGLSQPSSTRLLADRLAEGTRRRAATVGFGVEVVTIELRDIAHEIINHLLTGFPSAKLQRVIDQVVAADALITVTPVFTASYSGLFKSFFDILDPRSLAGKPVVLAATGGSARHSLVLDHALRPLFSHLQAVVVPAGVFAATADFGSDQAGRPLGDRVDLAAGQLVALLTSSGSDAHTVGAPVEGARVPRLLPGRDVDAFESFVPFEQLLSGHGSGQPGMAART